MSEESFKHPLGNIRLLDCTNYVVWKEDCMKVLQGIMTWNTVMEREEEPEDPGRSNDFSRTLFWHGRRIRTTSNGNRRPSQSSTDPVSRLSRYPLDRRN